MLRSRTRHSRARCCDRARDPAYRCQVTELYDASHELHWYDPRQYLRDLVSGNVGPLRMLRVALFSAFRNLVHLGYGYRLLTGTYDRIRRAMGKTPWPIRQGQCKRTPSEKLDLQPGEWVEVKSYDEILATLDPRNKNRGLYFDPEMTLFCGKRYRVAARVKKILDEKTGRMVHFPNECIILHNAVCVADYSQERLFCPRAIYPYWREIWLKRVEST